MVLPAAVIVEVKIVGMRVMQSERRDETRIKNVWSKVVIEIKVALYVHWLIGKGARQMGLKTFFHHAAPRLSKASKRRRKKKGTAASSM